MARRIWKWSKLTAKENEGKKQIRFAKPCTGSWKFSLCTYPCIPNGFWLQFHSICHGSTPPLNGYFSAHFVPHPQHLPSGYIGWETSFGPRGRDHREKSGYLSYQILALAVAPFARMTFPYLLSYMLRSYTLSTPVSGSKVLICLLYGIWTFKCTDHIMGLSCLDVCLARAWWATGERRCGSLRLILAVPWLMPPLPQRSPHSCYFYCLTLVWFPPPTLQGSRPTSHGHATISNGHLSVLLALGHSSFLSTCLASMEASSCFSSCFVRIQLHPSNH